MRASLRMTAATAAALTAALLVGGCGSGSEGDGDDRPAGEETQNPGADPETEKQPGSLQGIWSAQVDGEEFVLTIVADGVSLLRGGGTNCDGRMADGEQQTFALTCPGGKGQERANGTVESVSSEELTVAWNGGDTDTFDRVAEAPKDMPTDLGNLEDLLPE